jgi:spermidine synthase
MFCHGELAKRKPAPQYLTSFYLMLSMGGALGGILIGVVAPKVFPGYFELPVGLSACAFLLLFVNFRKWWLSDVIGSGLVVAVIMTCGYYINSFFGSSLVMERNFYGGLRVMQYDKGTEEESRTLVHGTITHGVQFTSPRRSREAVSYYAPSSGIGMAMKYVRRSPVKVGVIGLGAGSLAAYARPGDTVRFYEINPLVERLARQHFTYLSESNGKVEVVQGDARLSLEREPAQHYDLLAVDAFSGDSIPVHLLTQQAFELYFKHLKPTGILALHITNSHLALAPAVEKLATAAGKHAILISSDGDSDKDIYSADWVLISSFTIDSPAIRKVSASLEERPELRLWTDDYNNLFQVLKK